MDLVAHVSAIAARARAAEPTREQNRESDPDFSRWCDEVRAQWPGSELTKVRWPSGKEWARRPTWEKRR